MTLNPLFGPLAAFSCSAIWAFASPRYTKITVLHGSPAINMARAITSLLVACAVLAGRAITESRFMAIDKVDLNSVLWLSLSMLTSYGLGDALFFLAASRIGFSTALAIGSSFPLWSALAAWGFKGEILSAGKWIGLLLLIAGVITIVIQGRKEHLEKKTHFLHWVGVSIFVSILWAGTAFCTSQSTLTSDPVLATAIRMAAAIPAISAAAIGVLNRLDPKPLFLPRGLYLKFFPLFAVEGFGGALAYVYAMSHSHLAVASALSSLAPVLSVPFAIALGLERTSFSRIAALTGVVAGIWLLVGADPFH